VPAPSRLLDRLQSLYPDASRTTLRGWLERGRVRLNGTVSRRGDVIVGAADRVTVGAPPPPAFPAELRLVHAEADWLVVDKPAGLLTIATERERERTAYRLLSDWLAAGTPPRRAFIVHRLDRETSGLLVFATSPVAKRGLQHQFAARAVQRVYVAVVEGRVREDAGTLRGHLVEHRDLAVRADRSGRRGREAITRYRVLARRRDATILELTLVTGRRGQIRAQLAQLGHPIVGDADAGSRRDPLRRLCLHAARLGFTDQDGRVRSFESPPPRTFFTRVSAE
jgi:23S rRNA pseudouridine1911/1915/1917 synthase